VTDHNGFSETECALIAQSIEGLTARIQTQCIKQTKSYLELFTGDVADYSSDFKPIMALFQQRYSRRDWRSEIDQIRQSLRQAKAVVISITSPDYPEQLKFIGAPPPLLYVMGNLNNLHLPQIAIVGSRRMTRVGGTNARDWAKFLAGSGFVVTSGLALGVDGAAHQGALQAVNGKTIGVMATGIESVYPPKHHNLACQIVASGGTLVTEFHFGGKPLARHFPQRNRIISGLSLGVLVVEAAVKSGSLITARCAMEQNREVFAIPGSIHSPQSKGSHLLIKQGAHLVETAADIVAELGGALAGMKNSISAAQDQSSVMAKILTDEEQQVLEILGYEPIDLDGLMRFSPWSVAKLSQILVALELKNTVANDNGFYQRLV
tara:strand:+ start:861 stop:1994 length:1134 start_codon:yes stop_codon:yes gene_type:complete